MAIVECRECGREVSSAAKYCPGCGIKHPHPPRWNKLILWGAGLIFFAGLLNNLNNPSPLPTPKKIEKAAENPLADLIKDSERVKTINGKQFLACNNKEYYEKQLRYITDRDPVALVRGATAAKGCTIFRYGEVVLLEDTAVFSGEVKLRRKGETAEYWTAMEAIK